MSTTPTAATLFQLQELDLELDRLSTEYQTVLISLQGNSQLQRLRADFATAQQQLEAGLQTQKEAEWVLEDIVNRLQLQEQRLSHQEGHSRDLQTVQKEVQRLLAQQYRQEEVVSEVIDATDHLKESAQQKLALLQQAEADWQKESLSLLACRDQIETQQQELQAKRLLLASELDNEHISCYNAMRRIKQGRVVSKVEQNLCQWCRITLTPNELQCLRMGLQLQKCHHCGRILYYDR